MIRQRNELTVLSGGHDRIDSGPSSPISSKVDTVVVIAKQPRSSSSHSFIQTLLMERCPQSTTTGGECTIVVDNARSCISYQQRREPRTFIYRRSNSSSSVSSTSCRWSSSSSSDEAGGSSGHDRPPAIKTPPPRFKRKNKRTRSNLRSQTSTSDTGLESSDTDRRRSSRQEQDKEDALLSQKLISTIEKLSYRAALSLTRQQSQHCIVQPQTIPEDKAVVVVVADATNPTAKTQLVLCVDDEEDDSSQSHFVDDSERMESPEDRIACMDRRTHILDDNVLHTVDKLAVKAALTLTDRDDDHF